MNWMETPHMQRLEKYLDLLTFRQGLISSNVANVDTPGYRTQDVAFEDEMRRADLRLQGDPVSPHVQEVRGLIERPDGNNVSLDRESLALARTQLQFHAGVALLRTELHDLQTAINEGK